MKLEGIHHITCITADAPGNVDFYAGSSACGWSRRRSTRTTRPSTTSSTPTRRAAGSDLTFFEFPGARRGRAGAGMVHRDRLARRLAGGARLLGGAAGGRRRRVRARAATGCASATPRASSSSWPSSPRPTRRCRRAPGGPGRARAAGLRRGPRLRRRPGASRASSRTAGFEPAGDGWEARGETAAARSTYDRRPSAASRAPARVHHVAWASPLDEHEAWRERVLEAGARPTPVIDRFYFRSIYFREPSGVLFEIATIGPGFAVDEPLEHLGERLSLPPAFEHLREQVEPLLTPLPNPRVSVSPPPRCRASPLHRDPAPGR